MKISGAWEVDSTSRPNFQHRVTRYDIPSPNSRGRPILCVWCCTCESGFYHQPCTHIDKVKSQLTEKES